MPDLYPYAFLPICALTPFRRIEKYTEELKGEKIK